MLVVDAAQRVRHGFVVDFFFLDRHQHRRADVEVAQVFASILDRTLWVVAFHAHDGSVQVELKAKVVDIAHKLQPLGRSRNEVTAVILGIWFDTEVSLVGDGAVTQAAKEFLGDVPGFVRTHTFGHNAILGRTKYQHFGAHASGEFDELS